MPELILCVHATKPRASELAAIARSWWEDKGYEVFEVAGARSPSDDRQRWPDADLVVSLGGDGTMLHAVAVAHDSHAPVLGVNLGRMGYLTEVAPDEMESAFARYVAGDYSVKERMVVELSYGTEPGKTLIALNEAVVEKVEHGHTIRFVLSINGERFLRYEADGLIIATPTGSTAYNLSARGPVVSPSLRAILLTPISPHMPLDRSLVLGPEDVVSLELVDSAEAIVVADGTTACHLKTGDVITLRAAEEPARIVSFGRGEFLGVLRDRFRLADR